MLRRTEALLNSRSLTLASTDPAEMDCLTPGHFLVGQPLLVVPGAEIPNTRSTLVNRWPTADPVHWDIPLAVAAAQPLFAPPRNPKVPLSTERLPVHWCVGSNRTSLSAR